MSQQQPTSDLEQLLALTAQTAAQQEPEPVEAPSEALWQAFIANKLSEAEAEPVMAWLLANPEAYARWAESPVAARVSFWQRLTQGLQQWLPEQRWATGGLAAAFALVLAVALTVGLQSPQDAYSQWLADYAAQPVGEDLGEQLRLPAETDVSWGLVTTEARPEQRAFTDGFVDVRDRLLSPVALPSQGERPEQSELAAWYDFGRLHALLAAAVVDSRPQRQQQIFAWSAEQVTALQTQLRTDSLSLEAQLQQHIAGLQRSLAEPEKLISPRYQRRLALELEAGRLLFSTRPESAQ